MIEAKDIRVAGKYLRGVSHKERGDPCQDRTYSKSSEGVTVICLADGAGSYNKTEVGAEIATKFVADYICSRFDKIIKENEKTIAEHILHGVYKGLKTKAEDLNLDMKNGDLSSTLLFVAIKDNQYLAGHIGDGMIGYFENQKPAVLSYPENAGNNEEYTYFTTQRSSLDHFRVYKNKLNNIDGFILMSDGAYESLYSPKQKKLTSANITFLEWLQSDIDIIDIESSIADTIKNMFLSKSKKGDDCSLILLAITDGTTKLKDDQMRIDPEQLADNTKRIDQLESKVETIKHRLAEHKKELAQKDSKDDFKKYEVKLDQFISKQSKDIRKIDKLKKDINLFQNELSELRDDSTDNNWKKNVNTLLIIAYLGLGILTAIITKLLFFN